ncbi:MAG TPA: iron-containing redox enzyme family protein [Polyangiaceae bacterium]|jgi:pyrroloquinoline-quinone synthase|nr:iron-containing redox enzyme family protein [Polyangiaceae bacterium]
MLQSRRVDSAEFREQLLCTMEQKTHWAWPMFGAGKVPRELLHIHFEQEFATYVRDFPVMIGWAYVRCPIAEARRELAENLYEEETGGLVAKRPHPELFLEYPRGLGMDVSRFSRIELMPAAAAYRALLDELTQRRGWEVAAAVTTIFLEGTEHERGELDPNAPKRPAPPLEKHPLVVHYGLPLSALALTKAHRSVEGDHRQAAWRIVVDHVPPEARDAVLAAMKDVLVAWRLYRDELATACGLTRP